MSNFNRYKLIRDQKGSSLVLAIVILMIITVLGTSLMLASVTNAKLSSTQKSFTSDYYALDTETEAILYRIDENLKFAENAAEMYIQNRIYAQPPDLSLTFNVDYMKEVDSGDPNVANTFEQADFDFANSTFNANDDLINEGTYFIGDGSLAAYNNTYQLYFYNKYVAEVIEMHDPLVDDTQGTSLAQLERVYLDQIYNEVYNLMARKSLELAYTGSLGSVAFQGAYEGAAPNEVYLPQFTFERTFQMSSTIEAGGSDVSQIDLKIQVIDPEYVPVKEVQTKAFRANPVWTNALTAGGQINISGSTSVYGSVYINAKDDTDAFNENYGLHIISGTTNVYGNIYSRGLVDIRGTNSALNVRENVTGAFNSNPDLYSKYKAGLYDTGGTDTDFFLENFVVSTPAEPIPDITDSELVSYPLGKDESFWFFNRDKNGGNIYAKDIRALENTASQTSKGVSITAENAWTYGDLVMEAYENDTGSKAKIDINQNVIGLLNTSSPLSPNDSSTIHNNSFEEGGLIYLNKAYVPGKTFIGFQKLEDQTVDAPYYYGTLESITGNNARLFSEIYDGNIGNATIADLKKYTYVADTPSGPVDVDFMLRPLSGDYSTDDELDAMLNAPKSGSVLTDSIQTRITNSVDTGVYLNYDSTDFIVPASGSQNALIYSSGLLVGHYATGVPGNNEAFATAITSQRGTMNIKYSGVIGEMKTRFLDKTMSFGFDEGQTYKSIKDCVDVTKIDESYEVNSASGDSSLVQYLSPAAPIAVNLDGTNKNVILIVNNAVLKSNVNLNLTRDFQGIIYVNGDVTINNTGDNEIRGTLIVTGSTTINNNSGNLDIIYDEPTIARLVNLYQPIQGFFKPYEKGPLTMYELERYTSGTFEGLSRFKIVKWKEKTQL